MQCAPVAQLDRATGYEPVGRVFESLRAHHKLPFRNNFHFVRRAVFLYFRDCACVHGERCPKTT